MSPSTPPPARRVASFLLAAVLGLPALCLGLDVRVVGITPGRSADVVVDGGLPVTIDVGQATLEGVKLLSAERDRAVLRIEGVTRSLPLATYRGSVGDPAANGTVT